MMRFERFYEHFFYCRSFYEALAKNPAQERGLLLIGAALTKFDPDTKLIAMHDELGCKRNSIIVLARHRPPFWNANYSRAISMAIAGEDVRAAMKMIADWNIWLRIEFSQSCVGPANFVYPANSFPAVLHFDPNWEAIYGTITNLGYCPDDISACSVGSGSITMKDDMHVALDRCCYSIPVNRRNAVPDSARNDNIEPLQFIHDKRQGLI